MMRYRYLDTVEALCGALPTIMAAPILGVDIETTGLDPRRDKLRLVQVATADEVYVIDAFTVNPFLLCDVFESAQMKVFHNAKFDIQFLIAQGLGISNVYDTMLVDQLLRGCCPPRGLADLAEEYLGVVVTKTEQKADWAGELTPVMLEYAAKDAAVLLPLYEKLNSEVGKESLERVADLENKAAPAVAWLEYSGVPLDGRAWRDLADRALAEKLSLAEELTALAENGAGRNTLFGLWINWDSPEQVVKLLTNMGIRVPDTREATLLPLAHKYPLVRKLLDYRAVAKQCSAFGVNFMEYLDLKTGRVYADWYQIGAQSGRMACTKPNLQQIPRNSAYRGCFRAASGCVLVKADYSQIELRIVAEISRDARMIEAYRSGEDLHTLTAERILGKTVVTKADRQAAKAINFGLVYGMGSDTLREYAANNYGVTFSDAQASAIRREFFRTYKGVRDWHLAQPEGKITVYTLSGRRRLGVEKFTEKLNTPVQGTGADGIKAALGRLWQTRDRVPSARPVLVVHDEIVIECDEREAERAKEWLVTAMKEGMSEFVRCVPVEVEVTVARDWAGGV